MRVHVLYAHPVETSFAAALHEAVTKGLAEAGHEVDDCDLYAEGFAAVLTRDERLEHIWSSTHDDYRGYAGKGWPAHLQGKRTVLVYCVGLGTVLKPLADLTDDEIAAKLPVQLRHLPPLAA